MTHYLNNMPMLTNQWTPHNYRVQKQRLYLKDIDCPPLWMEKLSEQIPSGVFYLNESTGIMGGPGAADEPSPNGIGTYKGLGIAPAGDLMSSLPAQMRAENMMCYIGHEGTYTPSHREMCASLGQNIMVESSGTMGEDGKPTKPGSSIWFMTETKDRHTVAEYWLSTLGHDIEVESHFAQIMAWKQNLFTVYIVEQKVGDFILIPPLAPHQVWNRGTRTMKAAWNRTTAETLEMALNEALPRARMVCRDEQYKNKAIVLFTLNRYSGLLKNVQHQRAMARDQETYIGLVNGKKIKQLLRDFKLLFALFHRILLSESFASNMPERKVDYIPFDGNITCSYCRCNIFNRFLTCKNCVVELEDGSEDTYDVCMECYVMGRSCLHLSRLQWCEQFPWKDLVQKHEIWRNQIIQVGGEDASRLPLPLEEAIWSSSIKSLAQICQEQLKARPFTDVSKSKEKEPESASDSPSDKVSADGTLKKKPKKRRSEKWLREHYRCHICCHQHAVWKMAICHCGVGYCYGSLWRGFETMPQTIMEDPHWQCPKCQKICNCSKCRKNPEWKPFVPNATIIGHDTRKFADARSIEALVDFSSSNAYWVRKAGDDSNPTASRRLHQKVYEAEVAKSRGEETPDEDMEDEMGHTARSGTVPIDPFLIGEEHTLGEPDSTAANADGDMQRAAREALSALSGLSQLEQDPRSFAEQAGLGTPNGMIVRTADNGISYEYPDPHADLRALQPRKDGTEVVKAGNKRKRRTGYRRTVEDGAAVFPDDANRKFYKVQTQKTMAEAKKTGRLISAQAALRGESLVLKLCLPPRKLAMLQPSPTASTVPQQDDAQDDAPAVNVQSDLPKAVASIQAITRQPHVAKKRLRVEEDGDFGTRRDRQRKTASRPRAATPDHDAHTTGGSASDGLASDPYESVSEQPSSAPPKRRSLPAYLARRSPVAEDALPKELAGSERRRPAVPAQSENVAPPAPMMTAPPAAAAQPTTNGGTATLRPLPAAKPVRTPARAAQMSQASRKPSPAPAAVRTSMGGKTLTTAELNRRAKLRAINGEQSSDEESPDESAPAQRRGVAAGGLRRAAAGTPAGSPPGSGRKRGRPRTGGNPAAQPEPPEVRKSIFAKARRGSIRIMSARHVG